MESCILHISDIHLKGDYGGKFDVQGNLDAVIADAGKKNHRYDLIVLTGDIVDNGSVDEYKDVLYGLRRAFHVAGFPENLQAPILVTPGNHDNREALEEAFASFRDNNPYLYQSNSIYKFKFSGSFNVPGQAAALAYDVSSGNPVLCTLDTAHRDYPVEGLFRLLAMPQVGTFPLTLFTHMPMVRPFHRFMNQEKYTLPENSDFVPVMMKSAKVTTVCCGHYHHASTTMCSRTGLIQHVAPATQVQLDPYAKDCSPSGMYPGYNMVTMNGTVNIVETHFVLPCEDRKDEA